MMALAIDVCGAHIMTWLHDISVGVANAFTNELIKQFLIRFLMDAMGICCHNIDFINSIVKRISLIIWYTLKFIMLMNIHLGLLLLPLFYLYSIWTFKLNMFKISTKANFPIAMKPLLHQPPYASLENV